MLDNSWLYHGKLTYQASVNTNLQIYKFALKNFMYKPDVLPK